MTNGSTAIGWLAALGSMLFTGVALFLYRLARELGPLNVSWYYLVTATTLLLPFWLVAGEEHNHFPWRSAVWILPIAATFTVAIFLYNVSLHHLQTGQAATIRNLSFVVTVCLALLCREIPSPRDWLALCLAVSAIVLFGLK